MPAFSTAWDRINQSSSLRGQYARACARRTELMVDELLDITDTTQEGSIVTVGPKGTEVKTADMIAHRTLQVDTRKWLLAKLLPARFGDKVEHSGPGGGPIPVEHTLSAKLLTSLAGLRARLPAMHDVGGGSVPPATRQQPERAPIEVVQERVKALTRG